MLSPRRLKVNGFRIILVRGAARRSPRFTRVAPLAPTRRSATKNYVNAARPRGGVPCAGPAWQRVGPRSTGRQPPLPFPTPPLIPSPLPLPPVTTRTAQQSRIIHSSQETLPYSQPCQLKVKSRNPLKIQEHSAYLAPHSSAVLIGALFHRQPRSSHHSYLLLFCEVALYLLFELFGSC